MVKDAFSCRLVKMMQKAGSFKGLIGLFDMFTGLRLASTYRCGFGKMSVYHGVNECPSGRSTKGFARVEGRRLKANSPARADIQNCQAQDHEDT